MKILLVAKKQSEKIWWVRAPGRGGTMKSWASVGVCAGAGFTVSVVGSTGYTGDVAGGRG